MRTKVKAPNGLIITVEHPDGATQDEIIAYAQQNYKPDNMEALSPADVAQQQMLEEMPAGQKFLTGAGKAFVDVGRGTEQLARKMVPGVSERETELQQDIALSRERDKPLINTKAGMTGNIAGNVALFAPTSLVPGANTYTGSALAGALYGATQPTAEDESRVFNTALGAGGGAAGKALFSGGARVLNPVKNKLVEALKSANIRLTPGQVLGGLGKRIEEAATSVPILGDFIRSAQIRGLKDFNKAVANKVLAPLGRQADDVPVGREMFVNAHNKVSQFYDDTLKSLTVTADDQFANDINKITTMVRELPEKQQKNFYAFLKTEIGKRLGNGKVSGEVYKEMESEAGKAARGLKNAEHYHDRQLRSAYQEVRNSLREMLSRNAPDAAESLAKADEAYGLLKIMQDASTRAGSKSGAITPNQLSAAIRSADKSKIAQGTGRMQDFAEAAGDILVKNVPDSGTPLRLMTGLGLTGYGTYLDPLTTGAIIGTGGAMYSRPGQALIRALLNSRPEASRVMGQYLQKAAPYGALTGAALSQYGQ